MVRVPKIFHRIDLRSGRPLGEVVGTKELLIHFMTGGCINCLHVLEELRSADLPPTLSLVTVHLGKFDREREDAFVSRVAREYGIDHPIVNDFDGSLGDAFAIRAWPTLVHVDAKGYEIARASGEGKLGALMGEVGKIDRKVPESSRFSGLLATEDRLYLSRSEGIVLEAKHDGGVLREWEGLEEPRGISLHAGELFVSDRRGGAVVAFSVAKESRRVVVEGLRSPWGLTTDGRALQVAEAGNHRILQIGFEGGVEVLAGLGYEGVREGDAKTEALFAQPTDLDWLDGALYVVDAEGSALRKVEEGRVETPVGWDLFTFGDRDGIGEEVRLQHPEGVCAGIGGCGNYRIFLADTYNDKIKVYDPLTARVTTLVEDITLPGALSKVGCSLFFVDADEWSVGKFDISTMTLERIPIG